MGFLQRYGVRVSSCMAVLCLGRAFGTEPEWPRFRGPDANPVAAKGKLPEMWSKTQNVEWVAEIPRNIAGKILKRELRAPYWAGHERGVN